MRRLTIEEMREIAQRNNGACLSTEYVNNSTRLLWKCFVCGNEWETAPHCVKNGSWCPRCAKCEKMTIEDLKKIAEKRNGECLSKIYKDANTPVKWRCTTCKRIWYATPHNVKRGTWCPRCSKHDKLTLPEMRKLAKLRGGRCLSKSYENTDSNLLWECGKCGEIWEAVPYNIKKGTWCPKCAGVKKLSIKIMQEIAQSRGGKCLSDKYVNCSLNLLWECGTCFRTWKATPLNVKAGTWCPYCRNVGEELCRGIFEDIFKDKFPKVRPDWLRNEGTNGRMELDGFNGRLKIAFEYNGLQHYTLIRPFHSSEKELKECIQRDKLKRRLCKKRGVQLVIIPPLRIRREKLPYITKGTLKNFILIKIKRMGLSVVWEEPEK